jgi:hypothetical protein
MPLNVNPIQLISMIKNGQNPQQLMMNVLEGNAANNPMGANLLNLAKGNKTEELEKIARNIAKDRGIDFDTEFKQFKQMLGVK